MPLFGLIGPGAPFPTCDRLDAMEVVSDSGAGGKGGRSMPLRKFQANPAKNCSSILSIGIHA